MTVAVAWLVIFFSALVVAGLIERRELQAVSAQEYQIRVRSTTYRKGFWLGIVLMGLVYFVGLLGFTTGASWLGVASFLAAALLVVLVTAMRDDGWEFFQGALTGTVGTFLTLGFGISVFFFILTVG